MSGEQRAQKDILESIDNRLKEAMRPTTSQSRLAQLTWDKISDDLKVQGLREVQINTNSGSSSGTLDGAGKVVLRPLVQTNLTSVYLRTYRDIQAGAFVERFYGVFEVDDGPLAVLQDLTSEPTLAQMCASGKLPAALGDRLQLCCDISNSVAWFHMNEIQVKSLSDITVVMSSVPGPALHPILTKLESSRLVSNIIS